MAARCVGVSIMQYNCWSVVRPSTHHAPTLESLCQVSFIFMIFISSHLNLSFLFPMRLLLFINTCFQSVGLEPEEFEEGVRELQQTLWPTIINWPEYTAAMVLSVQLALAIKVYSLTSCKRC